LEWMTDDSTTTSNSTSSTRDPWGMVASTLSGIQLYDLRLRFPHVFMYDTSRRAMEGTVTTSFVNQTHDHIHHHHHHHQQQQQQQQAAKLQLQPDGGWTLAAALPRCNKVALWDLRRSKLPFQSMEHANVKGMQFCPLHRNTLATGGEDGIRLWNVQSGGERLHAPTVAPVTTLTWSLDRTEFMVGFGDHLGVYETSSDFTKIRKLKQWTQPRVGPVVAVERMYGENSGRVLSVHSESIVDPGTGEAMICWEPFPCPATTNTRKNDLRRRNNGDEDLRHTTLACSPVVR
jgi:WD40 repeat protein